MTPFDAVAPLYDETFTRSPVGQYQRAIVADILARRFKAGMRVLDIGCGTGVDAVFLAERGVRVTATDASPAMAALARRRAETAGVQDRVEVRVCPVEALSEAVFEAPFDGLLSNFGALNCLPDLRLLRPLMARHLRPGGVAVLCLFGRWCAWEMLVHLLRLEVSTAFRRMARRGADVQVGAGMVHVTYPAPRRLIRACRPVCVPLRTTGVGVLIPPSYLDPLVCRFPRVFRMLWRLERVAVRLYPVNRLGDHYCVEVKKVMRDA